MSAEIHHLDTASRPQNDSYKSLIGDIKNCLNEALSERLSHMFNSADDILFQLAENAATNEQQADYFDTMRLLRMERNNISQNFAEALKQYLKPKKPEPEVSEFDEDELSLVDQEEMEAMVAVSTMHSKAMNLFGDAVNHLEARLEVLAMKTPNCIDKQALIPKHICEAFQQALSEIELSIKNKLIIFKLFDQQVSSQLGKLYQSLNQILIDADILPQIKLGDTSNRPTVSHTPATSPQLETQSKQPATTSIATHSQVPATGYMATGHASGNNTQSEIHRVVNQFLQGNVTVSGPGIPASFSMSAGSTATGNAQYYDRRDIVKALSNLQHNFRQQNEVTDFVDAETFKRALLIDMGSRHGGTLTKQVNQLDEKTIDFIEMLFEVIVEDNSISDLVTNLLLRLQIPVIKVAMLDQEFFSYGEHPCRKVLDLIARIGTGINDKDDDTYAALEDIVDHLLEEFDLDIISFQTAVDQLNTLIEDEQQRTEVTEKQTQKSVLQEHARQIVLTELQFLVANKQLPKAVHPLILKNWSTLMFHCYIRSGKNSKEWNNSVRVLKSLLNSLQAITSHSAWLTLNNSFRARIETVQDMLLQTKQDRDTIAVSIQALADTYQNMLEESEYKHPPLHDSFLNDEVDAQQDGELFIEDINDTAEFDALPDIEADSLEPSPLDQQIESSRDKIAQLPADVKPGVWFEIFVAEDKPVRRLKLSVIIMEEATLVFVDRHGVKVIEKDAEEFAGELASEQSRPIADHSVFDHALGQVINSLSSAC